MSMKKSIEYIELKGHLEVVKLKEILEVSQKLERENKVLKEQVISLQNNMERGQQELITLKQELEQLKTAEEKDIGAWKNSKASRMEEFQSTIANMEMREIKLKQQIEEAKTWAQVVKEPVVEQKESIERQIKRQIKEEKDKQDKATNVIIKGLKDYGEKERTNMLARDFLRDKLNWTGYISQANRIGRKTENGKDRHVRVALKSI